MTGIGFLGAGVIIKEGASVRGLTTAASIWVTAAIGIVAGVGLYTLAFIGTIITILTLSLFRWLEAQIPMLTYANFSLTCSKDSIISEDVLVDIVKQHKISVSNMAYSTARSGDFFEYSMTLSTRNSHNFKTLSQALLKVENIVEYRIIPKGF